mgnify:CR=1 FL=1
MGTMRDTWNTTAERIRIQNPNYIMQGLSALHNFGLANGLSFRFNSIIDTSYIDYRYMCSREARFDRTLESTQENFTNKYNTFCKISTLSEIGKIKQNSEDIFPRFYPEMMSAKAFQSSYVSHPAVSNIYSFSNVVPEVYALDTQKDIRYYAPGASLFRDFSFDDDDIMFEYASYYSNNTDGNEQTLLWDREHYTNIKHQPTCVVQAYDSDKGVNIPIWVNMLSCIVPPPTNAITNSNIALWLALLGNAPLKFLMLDKTADEHRIAFEDCIIYGKKADWTKFFDSLGLPWSWYIDVVKSPDGDGLRKPILPGQPSNPVDDKPGDGDNISDTVEYPEVSYIPNSYTKYWITPDELVKLKEFLFKKTFLDNVSRLWENPAEYIVDLTYYPLRPDTLNMTGAQEQIIVGNINSEVTGLIFPDSGNRFHYMGAYHVEPYYNSYLDYEPYTSISIYLPYIGVRSLDSSRITGHTINVGYTFDFNTRQVTAHLGLDGEGFGDLGNALDSFTGSFGVAFPLSGSQANQVALNVLQSTTQLISSAGAIAGGVATGNVAAVYGGAVNAGSTLLGGQAIKPESLGTLTPTAGLYAPQIPYLIINRPITALPSTWAADMGYSAGHSGKVSSFTGYLEALHVELNRAANMTEQEAQEIITALQGGILI